MHRRTTLLALVLGCFCASSPPPALAQAQDAQTRARVERLADQFAKAFAREDWEKATELGQQLVTASPHNHVHPYNLACAYARQGDESQALLWLEKAAAVGFSDPELIGRDHDLDALRAQPRFAAVLAAVAANERRARELFLELAKDSRPIVLAPPGEGPFPVLVVLHGYGGASDGFAALFADFARREGMIVVAPRSVVPTPGGGFEWATAVDTALLVERALAEVERTHRVDPARRYLLGFSQGGRMAFEIALRSPGTFRGVVPIGAPYEGSVRTLAAQAGPDAPPFFLMVGSLDPTADGNRRAREDLAAAKVRVRFEVYQNVGHSFPPTWERELTRAFRFFDG